MHRPAALSLRSYGADGGAHAHEHVQVVLPLVGGMALEVGGRGGEVDASRGAFIAPGTPHAQSARGNNCFLILDCAAAEIGAASCERLARQPWLAIPPTLRRLLHYIDLRRADGSLPAAVSAHCLPLLLQALAPEATPAQRLHRLLQRIDAAPGQPWPVERMAAELHLSASRLHALFRQQLDTTPQAWLAELRLRHVLDALAQTDTPLATLALETGWADQTTLTRAMRRATGQTPAAYRRRQRRAQRESQ
ncbi:MAG TPA: AraC family transcriptional regulator [Stenotrophomonas sp.]|nr:AraC family transcriptional regulator [Stenotrophomonas sp.]